MSWNPPKPPIMQPHWADLAFWCGCARKFCNLCVVCPLMQDMFDCPFNAENPEAANCPLFCQMEINGMEHKFQKKMQMNFATKTLPLGGSARNTKSHIEATL